MKKKVIIFLVGVCIIGNLGGCSKVSNDKSSEENKKVESVNKDTDEEIDREENIKNNEEKENVGKEDEKSVENKDEVQKESDKVEEGENYYAKYDNFYNGTHALSVDFKGEGIGDNFLDYTFKINGKGNLSVEIASLRGIFKGDIEVLPNKFREWGGTIICTAENEKIDVEVRITDHALVIIEKSNGARQTTKFYYESKTFDLEHKSETIYTKKGNFELKKK
ncbi:MAG: hypothetical protein ACRCWM_10270 [Sarcina sp.]